MAQKRQNKVCAEVAESCAWYTAPTYYCRVGKRLFDIVLSSAAILVLLPLLPIISLLIKTTSHGPVFYRQQRVGMRGRLFWIVKFRSMVENADRTGPGITAARDARVTGFGSILRRFKLDELPQLWNVFRGDMSIVGPRPELPLYVASYDSCQKAVLTVRPGITDNASIAYRWEEEVLAGNPDPNKFYREVVLPRKLELNLQYISEMSLTHDLGLVFRTACSLFGRRSAKCHLSANTF